MRNIVGLSVTKPIGGTANVAVTWNTTIPGSNNYLIFLCIGNGNPLSAQDKVWNTIQTTGPATGLKYSYTFDLTGLPAGTYDVMAIIQNPSVTIMPPWVRGNLNAVYDWGVKLDELIIWQEEYVTGITVTPSSAQRGSWISISINIKNIGSVVKNFMVNIMVKDSFGISYSICQNYWTGTMQPGGTKTMVVDLLSPGYDALRVPAFVGVGDLPITVSLYDGSSWMGKREFTGKLYVNQEATVNITGYGTSTGWSVDNYPVGKTQTFSTGNNLYAFAEFSNPRTVIKYVLTCRTIGYLPWTGVYVYDARPYPVGSHIGVYFHWTPSLTAGTWHFWSRVQESIAHSKWEAKVS